MMPNISVSLPVVLAIFLAGSAASAATLSPAPVLPSSLLIKLNLEGQYAPSSSWGNAASPVAIGDHLYVVDERNARISVRDTNGSTREVVDVTTLPAGVTRPSNSGILNIAGEGTKAFVTFYSTTLPSGFSDSDPLPADDRYASPNYYELIFSYDKAADGSLSNPQPLKAFDAAEGGHRSAGMLVLPDGRLLYARGDNLRPTYDGLSAPQDNESSISKLLLIDGDTGASEIVAKGVRNVQRLTFTDETHTHIAFADIGWRVAEEINKVSVSDLIDTTTIENFGWGRNADGMAREGTFYVNSGPEADAVAIGQAPVGEAGFVQPFAQFGREDYDGFFAVSGPVSSSVSFNSIGLLFGDLASGDLFATLAGADGITNDVYSVLVKGDDGLPTSFRDLFGSSRDDLRFFNFSDNSAGVLFERSGSIYRITEIAAVPLAGSGWYLALMLVFGSMIARYRRLFITVPSPVCKAEVIDWNLLRSHRHT